jgi:hypothetical protein
MVVRALGRQAWEYLAVAARQGSASMRRRTSSVLRTMGIRRRDTLGNGMSPAGIAAAENFEKAKGRHLHPNRHGFELALLDEMQLVLAEVFASELIGRPMEVFSELPDRRNIGICGSLRVITALELFEHLFS